MTARSHMKPSHAAGSKVSRSAIGGLGRRDWFKCASFRPDEGNGATRWSFRPLAAGRQSVDSQDDCKALIYRGASEWGRAFHYNAQAPVGPVVGSEAV